MFGLSPMVRLGLLNPKTKTKKKTFPPQDWGFLLFLTPTPRLQVSYLQMLATHWSRPKVRAHTITEDSSFARMGFYLFLTHTPSLGPTCLQMLLTHWSSPGSKALEFTIMDAFVQQISVHQIFWMFGFFGFFLEGLGVPHPQGWWSLTPT